MKTGPDGRVARGDVKRSAAGLRSIALPPVAVEAVRAHRKRLAEERLQLGQAWQDHGLLFPSGVGTPPDPSHVRRVFARIAKRAGLDANFPYLLRHTAVSLLVDAGKSIEQVADMLGDDPRTLYRHYRHRVRPVADASLAMQAILTEGSLGASS
jgi:integrase